MTIQELFRQKIIRPLGKPSMREAVGEKAIGLRKLQKLGFQIPESYTCQWYAYSRFIQGDQRILDELRNELKTIIDPQKKYAVRSSSNIEDSNNFSFAGQFESLINVQSVDGVVDAIKRIWKETHSDKLLSYLREHKLSANEIKMGVIIQEMVVPVLSGVILTRNPVTNANEMIIEAVEGFGDQLMQKGSNAMRWVTKNGEIKNENTTMENYSPIIIKLAKDTGRIKKSLKTDVDIEWVFDGRELYYVQCRPISNLAKIKIYSNKISRDMLPGMIKPLVWSVNIPLVNSVWIDILESIVGSLNIKPEDLAHTFYYRTYFNMGIFGEIFKSLGMPPDALEIMMGLSDSKSSKSSMKPGGGIINHIPRIFVFLLRNLTIGGRISRDIRRIESEFAQIDIASFDSKDPDTIFSDIDKLKSCVKQVVYYNIVTPLIMGFHNRLLKQHLEKVKVDFISFDLMKDIPENVEFDPNYFLEKLYFMFKSLPDEDQKMYLNDAGKALSAKEQNQEFQNELRTFIQRFGHFSDSGNDFSYSPWRENIDLIIKMILSYETKSEANQKISFEEIKTRPLQKQLMALVFRNARKYRLLRDRVSSNYIFGYGIFRYYYLALGDKLVKQKLLQHKEDIFYLSEIQIRNIFSLQPSHEDFPQIVSMHKEKMKLQENITPPELIYGENEPALEFKTTSEYQGIPASAGFYRGPACIVKGVYEFRKVRKGDVLIIPFSDVGWTPLFPKAGAVISESGGMLSHCAIVAREYGIPSIVSALGVMNIKDGQMVTVDANAGILYLE